MTACAWFGEKQLPAGSCCRFGGVGRLTVLRSDPSSEIFGFFGDDKHRHMRMLKATKFGTLPAINPGVFGTNRQLVMASGNQVLLASEASYRMK